MPSVLNAGEGIQTKYMKLYYALHRTQYPVDIGDDTVLWATSTELQELGALLRTLQRSKTCSSTLQTVASIGLVSPRVAN